MSLLYQRKSPRVALLSMAIIALTLIIGNTCFGQTQSVALLSGSGNPGKISGDEILHIHIISGSEEYHSERSLKQLKKILEQNFTQVKVTASWGKDEGENLPSINLLAKADLMLVFTRRMTLPKEQLSYILQHIKSEKPVIGIRTASHAFQNFLELDPRVFGGDYEGHSDAETIKVTYAESADEHPILKGVRPWIRSGKMYHNPDLGPDTQTLLLGKGSESNISEPLAWINRYGENGRAFYTSMGLPSDFQNENFKQLLINAISWTTAHELQEK